MEKMIGIISANYSNSRMEGLTDNRSIASLPFGAQYRMIDFALSNFVNSGITSVGAIIPAQSRSLLDHISFGKNWRLDRKAGGLFFLPESGYRKDRSKINYILHDLSKNKEFLLRSMARYVAYSCTHMVYNIDYDKIADYMKETGADLCLIGAKNFRNYEYCLKLSADRNGRIKSITKKPKENDYAFVASFVMRRELLLSLVEASDVTDNRTFLDIVIGNLKNWDVRLYEHTGYVGHIGSVGDYYRCSLDLLKETVHREQFFSDRHIMTKIHDNAPTRYYKSATVKNSLINSNGNIFGTVENSIVFRNVYISEGAVVRNSIILPGGRVGQNAVVENAIVDKKCIVNDGSIIRGTETSPYVLRKGK